MCRRQLLMVLWLLIGTHSRLLVVGLLSIAGALCLLVSLSNDFSDPVFDGVGLIATSSRPLKWAVVHVTSCGSPAYADALLTTSVSLPNHFSTKFLQTNKPQLLPA